MRVTILGSGTAVPRPDRFPAGVLVEAAGQTVLIDAGPGVLRRLPAAGVDLNAIDALLLTHYHTDHTADVASLLFALRNPRYRGRAPLLLAGAVGLRAFLAHLTAAWPWLDPNGAYPLEVREIAPGSFDLGELQVTAVPIRHTAESLAYRIEHGDSCVAISGDADVCDGLAEVAREADLFVCDSAFPDGGYVEGHLTPGLAARAAAEAGVKTLCLTHFYPECEGHDLRAQAAAHFGGRIVLAEDLMVIDLTANDTGKRPDRGL